MLGFIFLRLFLRERERERRRDRKRERERERERANIHYLRVIEKDTFSVENIVTLPIFFSTRFFTNHLLLGFFSLSLSHTQILTFSLSLAIYIKHVLLFFSLSLTLSFCSIRQSFSLSFYLSLSFRDFPLHVLLPSFFFSLLHFHSSSYSVWHKSLIMHFYSFSFLLIFVW